MGKSGCKVARRIGRGARRLRFAAGKARVGLVGRGDLGYNFLSVIERGEKVVRASAIERLCRTLRVSPSLRFERGPATPRPAGWPPGGNA